MTNVELDRLLEITCNASADYGQDNEADRLFYETAYEVLPYLIARARRASELEAMLLRLGYALSRPI